MLNPRIKSFSYALYLTIVIIMQITLMVAANTISA